MSVCLSTLSQSTHLSTRLNELFPLSPLHSTVNRTLSTQIHSSKTTTIVLSIHCIHSPRCSHSLAVFALLCCCCVVRWLLVIGVVVVVVVVIVIVVGRRSLSSSLVVGHRRPRRHRCMIAAVVA